MRVPGESLCKDPIGRNMMISLGGQEKEAGAEWARCRAGGWETSEVMENQIYARLGSHGKDFGFTLSKVSGYWRIFSSAVTSFCLVFKWITLGFCVENGLEWGQFRAWETNCYDTVAIVQATEDGGSNQKGMVETVKKSPDSECILKGEPRGFTEELDLGLKGEEN